jgi:hypothetical protein
MGCHETGLPYGVAPDDVEVDAHARGGNVCAGYLYPLAILQNATIAADTDPITGAAYVVSRVAGYPGSVFANVKGGTGAASTDGTAGLYAVAMEDVLDEKKGKFKIRGLVRAYVADSGNTAITRGLPLIPVLSSVLSTPSSLLNTAAASVGAGANPRYVGHVLEANASTPSTPILMLVNFDGWNGFGAANSTS